MSKGKTLAEIMQRRERTGQQMRRALTGPELKFAMQQHGRQGDARRSLRSARRGAGRFDFEQAFVANRASSMRQLAPQRPRVGILSITDHRKGLWRDMQTLIWVLCSEPVRLGGAAPTSVTVFCADAYRGDPRLVRSANVVEASLFEGLPDGVDTDKVRLARGSLAEFADTVDTVISFERLPVELFDRFHQAGRAAVYVPNVDWATHDGSVARWAQALRNRPWIDVWAKQRTIEKELARQGVASTFVPWSIPEPVVCDRDARPVNGATLLVNAGNGGFRSRRAVDLVLKAFQRARQQADLKLVVKSNKPLSEYVPAELLSDSALEDVEVIEGFRERAFIESLHGRADAVVHVSRWEGFGVPMFEALHAGLPVIATDGWPVGDMIEEGHNGILVRAKKTGEMNMAPIWEVDVDKLASAMVRMADHDLRDRMTCPSPGELLARQHAFRLLARQRLLGEPEPHVIVVAAAKERKSRRSENYWADALRACGYRVTKTTVDGNPEGISRIAHDFVLVGKPPHAYLKKLRQSARYVVLWHHDAEEYTRHWFPRAKQHVDLACVPYLPSDSDRGRVVMVHPGPRATGSRGPGKRSVQLHAPHKTDKAVFIGVRCAERGPLLAAIAAKIPLVAYGTGWENQPVWDAEADAVYRRAAAAFAVSRYIKERTPFYTSNRLFHATAVGAHVFAERFQGLEQLFPESAVTAFVSAAEAARLFAEFRRDRAASDQVARNGEKHCWRNHSWEHRVLQILQLLAGRCGAQRQDMNKKLNIGCGERPLAGYVNIDVRRLPGVDLVANVLKGVPLDDGCAKEVVVTDFLEHFTRADLETKVLPELRRLLTTGGKLVAQLPDLELMFRDWKSGAVSDRETSRRIHGGQDYEFNFHYASYTQREMTQVLRDAGFCKVERTATRNWNMELTAEKDERPDTKTRTAVQSPPQKKEQRSKLSKWARYWDIRARSHGERATVPTSWSQKRYEQETARWWEFIMAEVDELAPDGLAGLTALDFGCGAGRFSELLASRGAKVVGVDHAPSMVKLAVKRGIDAHLFDPSSGTLPLAPDSVDLIWSCTVLQHVPDDHIEQVLAEIRRVAKPGALVVLFENTTARKARQSNTGHVVFRLASEYKKMFPGVEAVKRMSFESEYHDLLIGRLADD